MSNQSYEERVGTSAPLNDAASGRKPDYIAYNVTEGRDGKGFFNKVGAAWPHKDGQGYELKLDSIPVDGRVTLRELREERLEALDGQRQAQQVQEQAQPVNRGYEQGR